MVGTSPEQARQAVAVGGYSVDRNVLAGIRQASRATGVDFGYLMAQAAQESSFQSNAQAGTSSATGLYQFIDGTWLDMVREHGAKHGLGNFARHIQRDAQGTATVADPATRKQILELRKDPRIAAALGAEFAKGNREQLENRLQRPVGGAELYMAHFLGANGAGKFLEAIERDGDRPAVRLLPEAAAANRNVFFDKDTGRAKSLREIYRTFQKSIDTKSQLFAGLAEPSAPARAAPAPAPAPTAPPRTVAPTEWTGRYGLSTFSILALSALEILGPAGDPQSSSLRRLARV